MAPVPAQLSKGSGRGCYVNVFMGSKANPRLRNQWSTFSLSQKPVPGKGSLDQADTQSCGERGHLLANIRRSRAQAPHSVTCLLHPPG